MPIFKLVAIRGDKSLRLDGPGPRVLGRSPTSELSIADNTISRRHAELCPTTGGVRIRDLGSANGTRLNGARIEEATARPGDVLVFGGVSFRLVEEGAPPPAAGAFESPAELDASIVRRIPVTGRESLDTSRQPTTDAPEHRLAHRLSLLLEVSKALSAQPDVDRLLERIASLVFQVTTVQRVSILLAEGTAATLVPRITLDRRGKPGERRQVPETIARLAAAERVAILTDDALVDIRFPGRSVQAQRIRSAMCAPLVGSSGEVLGVIYGDNPVATGLFTEEDLEFLVAFSSIAATAIERGRLTDRLREEAVVLSNLQRYLAPDVVEQIVRHKTAVQLGGTRREVTVLFSDIRGFTSLSEKMEPEDIVFLLNEYFTEMADIVFEHGGTLDKFIGDALLALWGAPISHGDDADRAVRAAMAMQHALGGLNTGWIRAGRPRLEVGIGIDRDVVFVGNIGSDRRLEYTVVGDAVNTASRLCSMAKGGEILVSARAWTHLLRPPSAEPLDSQRIRGKEQDLAVYRVDWRSSRD